MRTLLTMLILFISAAALTGCTYEKKVYSDHHDYRRGYDHGERHERCGDETAELRQHPDRAREAVERAASWNGIQAAGRRCATRPQAHRRSHRIT